MLRIVITTLSYVILLLCSRRIWGVFSAVGRCPPLVPEHEEEIVGSWDLFIDLRLRTSDARLRILPADGHEVNSALTRLRLVVLSDDVPESEPFLLEAFRRCEEDAIFLEVAGHSPPHHCRNVVPSVTVVLASAHS